MRWPGLEPGSPRWQRDILTTILPALRLFINLLILNVSVIVFSKTRNRLTKRFIYEFIYNYIWKYTKIRK
jgi:hypothetical protein